MITESMRAAPLPCPFCGHVGLDFCEGSTFRWLSYSCGGCGTGNETRIQTLGEGTNEEWLDQAKRDAVEHWNTRVAIDDATVRLTDEQLDVAWRMLSDVQSCAMTRDLMRALVHVARMRGCDA